MLDQTAVVVTVHGEESEEDGEGVFMGGLDEALGGQIGDALARKGFDARAASRLCRPRSLERVIEDDLAGVKLGCDMRCRKPA